MARNPSRHDVAPPAHTRTTRKRARLLVGGLLLLGLCALVRWYWAAESATAGTLDVAPSRVSRATTATIRPSAPPTQTKGESARPASEDVAAKASAPAVAATVNNQRITRDELADQCRRQFGQEVLESIVNKRLIAQECERRGIRVTRAQVDAEIARMAKRFSIPVDQWLKLLKQERNITPEQYANDIIWPTLALRQIAGDRLRVSRDEIVKEFETLYGEAVRARLIAVSDPEKAEKLRTQAAAKPADFGNLAKDFSEDAPSASAKGVISPIRKHGSYREIEDAVFNMPDGAVSPVIHAGGQYVILKREGLLPARQINFEEKAPQLEEILRDRKMRSLAQDVFQQLQKGAKVENVWNDPARRKQLPGVAATINGEPLGIGELDDECIGRHGAEVLEGMIARRILEQACRRQSVEVTDAEIDAEIALAALVGVRPKADGSPDVEAWLAQIHKQGIPLERYRADVVWPTAALKKLVGKKVTVTEDDLRKGYEANYGPRVRCLAIVLDNQRRAQQVFEMARKDNTSENFGRLAAEYSVEASSKAMRGEVPPIKKYGGRPTIEDEAFRLQPGEISGVIQVDDKFVLLRCEGYTKPTTVGFDEVREEIRKDIYEKKLRLAMTERFEALQEAAVIDNFIAGTSHAPTPEPGTPAARAAANIPALRQVPAR